MSKPSGRRRAARNSATLSSFPGGFVVSMRMSSESRSAVSDSVVCPIKLGLKVADAKRRAAILSRHWAREKLGRMRVGSEGVIFGDEFYIDVSLRVPESLAVSDPGSPSMLFERGPKSPNQVQA